MKVDVDRLSDYLKDKLPYKCSKEEFMDIVNEGIKDQDWRLGSILSSYDDKFLFLFDSFCDEECNTFRCICYLTKRADGTYEFSRDMEIEWETSDVHLATPDKSVVMMHEIQRAGYVFKSHMLLPKFSRNDWIIHETLGTIYKITKVGNDYYTCVAKNTGDIATIPIECTDKVNSWRLWNITDAKPGDILITKDSSVYVVFECLDPDEELCFNSCFSYVKTEGEEADFCNEAEYEWTRSEFIPVLNPPEEFLRLIQESKEKNPTDEPNINKMVDDYKKHLPFDNVIVDVQNALVQSYRNGLLDMYNVLKKKE